MTKINQIRLNRNLSELLREAISYCPYCSQTRIIRRRTTTITIQFECLNCGMRFTVYWDTLISVQKKDFLKIKDEEDKKFGLDGLKILEDLLKQQREKIKKIKKG